MASPNAGGFVELTLNGTPYSIAGELEIEETNFEAEAVVNQDGSIARTVKPKPRKMMLKFRDRQGTASIVAEIFAQERFDVSARQVHMNRTVLLTGAFAVGKPKLNTANGEVDGIELVSDSIQYVT